MDLGWVERRFSGRLVAGPQAMLFAKSLGALGITIASVVILTLSGYHARHGGLLIFGGAALLMAIAYWAIAAASYKKSRQREEEV